MKEMQQSLSVLDHGIVRLIDSMGSDLSIARNARVSYDAAWRAGEDSGSDKKLINYLWRNGHSSPFECVQFTFEIKMPIFVIRQFHRHRLWSHNEISARYRELPEEYYVPDASQIGKQSTSNKQMRDISEGEKDTVASMVIDEQNRQSFATYRQLLDRGVPRELARTVLPLGTYSHMFSTIDLNNLFKFVKERTHEHAQHEIRVYAQAMLDLITPIVPVAVEAFEAGRHE